MEKKLEMAPCETPCRDIWRMERVRYTAMRAYKVLEERGAIRVQYPLCVSGGRLTVKYDAQAPREWVLEALRDVEREITLEMLAEMDEILKTLRQRMKALGGEASFNELMRLRDRYEFLNERIHG